MLLEELTLNEELKGWKKAAAAAGMAAALGGAGQPAMSHDVPPQEDPHYETWAVQSYQTHQRDLADLISSTYQDVVRLKQRGETAALKVLQKELDLHQRIAVQVADNAIAAGERVDPHLFINTPELRQRPVR